MLILWAYFPLLAQKQLLVRDESDQETIILKSAQYTYAENKK